MPIDRNTLSTRKAVPTQRRSYENKFPRKIRGRRRMDARRFAGGACLAASATGADTGRAPRRVSVRLGHHVPRRVPLGSGEGVERRRQDAFNKATAEREKSQAEFDVKQIHQKPEVFKIDILRTREDRVLVKVEGQLVRVGAFENQNFTESPKFALTLTFARNPDMLANKRFPLGVWSYESKVF